MSRLNEYRKNLEEFKTAETTAAALEDISALRLQAIRKGFENNRSFYEGIRDLYGIVRAYAENTRTKKKKKRKQLLVALTSNKRFYGGLMREVMNGLARSITAMPKADAIVIGRAGWQYAEQMALTERIRQIIVQEDSLSREEFEMLLGEFANYESVLVLYPKFINPFRQDVGIEDITQSLEKTPGLADKGADNADLSVVGYIFEPEASAILSFFDAQVVRVLFQGVLFEAELARIAARLIRLEEAQESAHQLVRREEVRIRKEVTSIAGSGLLETFAGFSRWHRI